VSDNKPERLQEKIHLSDSKSICDIGFHYGTDGKNLETFPTACNNPRVFGLKVYAGKTTGELLVNDPSVLDRIFVAWESSKPILLHTTGDLLKFCLDVGKKYKRRVHVCHVSNSIDLDIVRKMKESYKKYLVALLLIIYL